MDSLTLVVWFDAACLLVCGGVLLTRGWVRHSHPSVIYLIFHVTVFSVRAWAIADGAPGFLNLTEKEAASALLIADLFLVALTLGWTTAPTGSKSVRSRWASSPMKGGIVIAVAWFAVPVGLVTMARFTSLPSEGTAAVGTEVSTSYQTMAVTWPGLMLIALVYKFGFRTLFLMPLAAYLLLMALQAQNRFAVVLPAILLVQIYLDRRGRRWPGIGTLLMLVALAAVFYPMDAIGQSAKDGTLTSERLRTIISDSTTEALEGESSEQGLFDAYAVTLAQADRYGSPMWGDHYVDLLALPVPRPWWPEKPSVVEHLEAISTVDRPLSTIGTVVTLPGEAYIDFRLPGVFLIGFAFARLSAWAYRVGYACGVGSVGHFLYLLFAASLIQVYRDGLISIPMFMLVHNFPLILIAVLHWAAAGGKPVVPPTLVTSGRYRAVE